MSKKVHPELASLLAEADASGFGMSRRHIRIGQCYLYLRIGPRLVSGEMVRCLQIGTADVPERLQRQGHFSRALEECLRLGLPIFIESVQNIPWSDAMVRRGFRIVNRYMDDLIRDLFLPVEANHGD